MSDTLASDTAKKQQSLLHVGSSNRDALEAIGATYEPPMRWQDLARTVLKNFIAGTQHDAALKRMHAKWAGALARMAESDGADDAK